MLFELFELLFVVANLFSELLHFLVVFKVQLLGEGLNFFVLLFERFFEMLQFLLQQNVLPFALLVPRRGLLADANIVRLLARFFALGQRVRDLLTDDLLERVSRLIAGHVAVPPVLRALKHAHLLGERLAVLQLDLLRPHVRDLLLEQVEGRLRRVAHRVCQVRVQLDSVDLRWCLLLWRLYLAVRLQLGIFDGVVGEVGFVLGGGVRLGVVLCKEVVAQERLRAPFAVGEVFRGSSVLRNPQQVFIC